MSFGGKAKRLSVENEANMYSSLTAYATSSDFVKKCTEQRK